MLDSDCLQRCVQIACLGIFCLWASKSAVATARHWVGPTGGIGSDPLNWSAAPGGGRGGAGPPQAGDAAAALAGMSAQFDYIYGQPGIGWNFKSPMLIEQN